MADGDHTHPQCARGLGNEDGPAPGALIWRQREMVSVVHVVATHLALSAVAAVPGASDIPFPDFRFCAEQEVYWVGGGRPHHV